MPRRPSTARKRLERVCRYLLRPPFAYDAVQALARTARFLADALAGP